MKLTKTNSQCQYNNMLIWSLNKKFHWRHIHERNNLHCIFAETFLCAFVLCCFLLQTRLIFEIIKINFAACQRCLWSVVLRFKLIHILGICICHIPSLTLYSWITLEQESLIWFGWRDRNCPCQKSLHHKFFYIIKLSVAVTAVGLKFHITM